MSKAPLTKTDPAWCATVAVVDAIDGLDRRSQLRILASACMTLGDYAYARRFLDLLEDEEQQAVAEALVP